MQTQGGADPSQHWIKRGLAFVTIGAGALGVLVTLGLTLLIYLALILLGMYLLQSDNQR